MEKWLPRLRVVQSLAIGAAPALNYGELRFGSIGGTSQGALPTERAYRLLATVKAGVAARSGPVAQP
ncbi:hypothetical protein MPLB_1500008 [Mesorhizobium sp. ORS 3324]|nr:hypothetical protein MPLB_1500008 [Mesorhizobium sp. ORS 3324]